MMNGYHGEEESADDDKSVGSFHSDSDEEGSASDDGSTDMSAGGGTKTDELKLARKESNFVLCSKFAAYLVLFLSAVAAGITAYYITHNQEVSEFERDVSPEET